jgi:hypothetical protein
LLCSFWKVRLYLYDLYIRKKTIFKTCLIKLVGISDALTCQSCYGISCDPNDKVNCSSTEKFCQVSLLFSINLTYSKTN